MTFPLKPVKTLKKRIMDVYPQATVDDQYQVHIPDEKRHVVLDGRTMCTVTTRWSSALVASDVVVTKNEHVEWHYDNFEKFDDIKAERTTCLTIRRNIDQLVNALPGVDVGKVLVEHYSSPNSYVEIQSDPSSGHVLVYQKYYICEKVNAGNGTVYTRVRQTAMPPLAAKMIYLDL